jgi:tRNA modification GTPase
VRPHRASDTDTIVAPATPPSRGALCLVRISGRQAFSIVRGVYPELPDPPPARRARVATLIDEKGEVFDRGVITCYPEPASFTGEDVAEIALHGNPLLVGKLLAAASKLGARPAGPGEFSRRAFLNGKMSLIEAESVGELIDAKTEAAARGALSRLSGSLQKPIAEARLGLLTAVSLWTAAIDFPEQAGEEDPEEIARHLSRALDRLEELASRAVAGARVFSGLRVVIVGPPNAGKSTIFNRLVGRNRAIVTEQPGTTRDTVEEEIELEGIALRLVDTAGIREASEPAESEGIARAREELARADVILFVHELGLPWSAAERAFFESVGTSARLLILNKADLSSRNGEEPGLALCALDSAAASRLKSGLSRLLRDEFAAEAATEIVSRRQGDLLRKAADETAAARALLLEGRPAEICVSHAEGALSALSELAGETTPEDALDVIFSSFCIGK